LAPTLGLRYGLQAETLISDFNGSKAQLVGELMETYVLGGVKAWTFVDSDGKPLPVTESNVRSVLLSDLTLARPVADKADDLYSDVVLEPFRPRSSKRSAQPSTAGSTSVNGTSASSRRRPRKSSSTTTSQTGVTATTTS
jgi:hypothetical protein